MTVYNMPQYAYSRRYTVYRTVDGKAWFYGAWDDESRAAEVAAEVDGSYVQSDEVD